MWEDVGGKRDGVYSYTWENEVDYDSDGIDNDVLSDSTWDNNRVDINAQTAIPDLESDVGLTFALWVCPQDVTWAGGSRPHYGARSGLNADYAHLIALGGYGDVPIMSIELDSARRVHGFVEGDGADTQYEITGTDPVAANIWSHIAITYDRLNNEAKTYVNGVLDSTTLIPGVGDGDLAWSDAMLGGGFMTIGGSRDNTFMGKMDDVRIYYRVLSQSEIALFAENGTLFLSGERPVS